LFELLLGSGKLGIAQEDLALEFSMLAVQLTNTIGEGSSSIIFVSDELVESINKFVSEVVEGANDLLDGTLVGEVSFSGELKKSLDEGTEGGVAVELLVKKDEVALDLLDLDEGWVLELGKEAKTLINCTDGVVGFSDLLFEGGVLVVSLDGLEIEVPAVIGDVGL